MIFMTWNITQTVINKYWPTCCRCRNMSDKAPEPWSFDNEGPTTTLSKKLLSNASISRMSSTISLHPLPDSHETSTEKAAQNTLLGMIAVALGAGFSCTGYCPMKAYQTNACALRSSLLNRGISGGIYSICFVVRHIIYQIPIHWFLTARSRWIGPQHIVRYPLSPLGIIADWK